MLQKVNRLALDIEAQLEERRPNFGSGPLSRKAPRTAARQKTTRLDKFLVVGGMEVLSSLCQTALETMRYSRSAVRSYYSSIQNDRSSLGNEDSSRSVVRSYYASIQ